MKIQILSDTHNECSDALFVPAQTDAELVLLAGDIGRTEQSFRWAAEHFHGKRIVMVAGNHEAWGAEWHAQIAKMRRLAPRYGIDFLENNTVTINGVKFVGAMLFTDMELFGREHYFAAIAQARRAMPDFQRIRLASTNRALKALGICSLMTPEDSVRLHRESRDYIAACLREPFDGPIVVLTHHAPSARSVAKQFENDPLSPCFASRLDEMILASNVTLWVHGHTHTASDYCIGRTRVVCNPVGYRDYLNGRLPETTSGFRPGLVIDIEDTGGEP